MDKVNKNDYNLWQYIWDSLARTILLISAGGVYLTQHQKLMGHRILSCALWTLAIFMDIGVWVHDFHIVWKIILAVLASVTTLMAFANSAIVFKKNFAQHKIYVTVIGFFKKNRHRSGSISKPKR